jgi:hypothetical protein
MKNAEMKMNHQHKIITEQAEFLDCDSLEEGPSSL